MTWTAGQVVTAAQLNANAPQEWTTWTPTITSETGTLTSTSITSARYAVHGDTVVYELVIVLTNAGTGAGGVRFTLPVTARAAGLPIGWGRENTTTGHMLVIHAFSTTLGYAAKYDNTTPIATGRTLAFGGVYEAA